MQKIKKHIITTFVWEPSNTTQSKVPMFTKALRMFDSKVQRKFKNCNIGPPIVDSGLMHFGLEYVFNKTATLDMIIERSKLKRN